MSEIMTIKQLADYLQLPVPSLYQLAQRGKLPAAKVGKHWRFHRDVIDEWLRNQSSKTRPAILVVDDEELVRQTFADSLIEVGCQVTLAADGNEALERIGRETFDLIFLDLIMPGRNGVEVLKEMRAQGCQTPVVLVTAYPESEMLAQALMLESITLVRKPIGVRGIQATVASLLRLQEGAA